MNFATYLWACGSHIVSNVIHIFLRTDRGSVPRFGDWTLHSQPSWLLRATILNIKYLMPDNSKISLSFLQHPYTANVCVFSLLTFTHCSLLFFMMKLQIHRDVFAKKYQIKLYFNCKTMYHKPLKVKILRPSDCDLVTLYISIFRSLQSLSRPFYFFTAERYPQRSPTQVGVSLALQVTINVSCLL